MQNWIQLQILENLIQSDVFVLILTLTLAAWIFYKVFLRSISEERHKNLKGRFGTLFRHTFVLVIFYILFFALQGLEGNPLSPKFIPYVGFLTVVWGSIVFIQACRIMVLQYLFLTSMRAGVPLLLVNIFTIVLSLFLASWIAASLFGIQVGPLLATSAAFSLILGLALQDTLGNLFAGISLQLDHTFEIGDWLEIINGSQKIIGQVKEITWRAVFLAGLSDEEVIVPNRVMAQSQVSNWTREDGPTIKAMILKIKNEYPLTQLALLKKEMVDLSVKVKGVRQNPSPIVLISDVDGNQLNLKVVFSIDDYGMQNLIVDALYCEFLSLFEANKIDLAVQKIELIKS